MDLRSMGLGLGFVIMWSSAFTSARIIVAEAPPISSLSLRFFISGVIGVLIARFMGQTWHLTRAQWKSVVIFGICQNALYLGLNFVAMQWIEASLASIIASTMPLIVALIGWLAFGDRLRPMAIAGLVAGIIGVMLIMGSRFQGNVDLTGIVLCAIAAVSLAVATLSMRGASSGGNFMMVVGLQMLVGALALLGPALAFETWDVVWNTRLIIAFGYTTLIPGLVATLVWFYLVDRIGAVRASTYHFLNPFFGVAIAAWILSEPLHWVDVIGVAIIAGGILAVQLAKQKAA